jgi:hypothetical protein
VAGADGSRKVAGLTQPPPREGEIDAEANEVAAPVVTGRDRVLHSGARTGGRVFEDRPIDKGNGDPTRMRFYFQRSSHKEPEHYVEVWLDTDTGSINVRSADQILIAPLVSNGVQVMVVRS